MLYKVRIAGEVIVLAMFENEYAIGLQEILLEYKGGNLGQLFQSVRRIGKDEVKLLLARLDETEGVATKWDAHLCIQFLQTVGYKTVVVAVHLYANHVGATARY